MVHLIAAEFLTDERDRKYYADHYTCCPPPLFIILITFIEVSLQFFGILFYNTLKIINNGTKRLKKIELMLEWVSSSMKFSEY